MGKGDWKGRCIISPCCKSLYLQGGKGKEIVVVYAEAFQTEVQLKERSEKPLGSPESAVSAVLFLLYSGVDQIGTLHWKYGFNTDIRMNF